TVEGPSEPFTENQINSAIPALNQFERDRGFVQKGIKVEDVSQQLELPPRLISYVIKTTKKENFSSYINRLRLEYAARQINESAKLMNLSVQGVAETAGFASRQIFSKLFHELFGVSPKEYMQRVKKERDG
ncbi:helix-turn-helix domain-containing protein, partial [Chryseobacterium sp. A301]